MPIKKKIMKGKPKGKVKQVIHKSKGQNIQIHIDLSKKQTKKHTPIQSREPAQQKQQQQPYPMFFGFQPQQQQSNGMADALNLILAQNARYEQALRNAGEQKRMNPITKMEEQQPISPLAEIINKSHPTLQQEYGEQLGMEEQKEISSLGEDEEEYYEDDETEPSHLIPPEGQRYRGRSLEEIIQPPKPKKLNKMNVLELVQYAVENYDIEPYYQVQGTGRNSGKMITKQKTKKQLIDEIEKAKENEKRLSAKLRL